MEAVITRLRSHACKLAGMQLCYNSHRYGRTNDICRLPLDNIPEFCFDQFKLTGPGYGDKHRALLFWNDLPFACVRVTFPQRRTPNMAALDKVRAADLLAALHSEDLQVTISIDTAKLRAHLQQLQRL